MKRTSVGYTYNEGRDRLQNREVDYPKFVIGFLAILDYPIQMQKFRIMSGICSISDGEIHVKKGVREGLKSMYVGSKLYLFSVLLTVSWAVISMIFDSGIFVREIALWILDAGIFIGGMIGLATYLRIASNNETSRNNIPTDHINHPSSVKRLNRKPTATCGSSNEERVTWMNSPRKRSVLS